MRDQVPVVIVHSIRAISKPSGVHGKALLKSFPSDKTDVAAHSDAFQPAFARYFSAEGSNADPVTPASETMIYAIRRTRGIIAWIFAAQSC